MGEAAGDYRLKHFRAFVGAALRRERTATRSRVLRVNAKPMGPLYGPFATRDRSHNRRLRDQVASKTRQGDK